MINVRIGPLCALAALLGACAGSPSWNSPGGSSAGAAPSSASTGQHEAEPPAPPTPAVPTSPSAQQQAYKAALSAASILESGSEDQARAELLRALALDPNSKLAQSLMHQITADPIATLGRESFAYTLRSGDTLSSVAERFLGDRFTFYLLARYNDIKVPRQVAAGQTMRVPGKTPSPFPSPKPETKVTPQAEANNEPPAPTPVPIRPAEPTPGERALQKAEAAERSGDLALALAELRRASTLDPPPDKIAQLQQRLVSRFTHDARSAFAKQDLDGSIRNWDRVLTIDPGNDTAQLEKQRSIALKEKVRALK